MLAGSAAVSVPSFLHMTHTAIVWFRGKDLRLADHTPLLAAQAFDHVIPLFVLDPYFFAPERAQRLPHRMQFLLQCLSALSQDLQRHGSRLVVVAGKSTEIVPRLANSWGATKVLAQRWSEPFARTRDKKVAQALGQRFELHEGELLMPPGVLRTGKGTPYGVFTPFAKAHRRQAVIGTPQPVPKTLKPLPPDFSFPSAEIPGCEDLGIQENPRLLQGGEAAGRKRLSNFVAACLNSYDTQRDRMDVDGTSRLSADLKFGTLSIREIWHRVQVEGEDGPGKDAFLGELLWREFSHNTLWDRPQVLLSPFRENFQGFPWREDDDQWLAWTQGQTGYPVVDAAARQLLREGFVHNRARMITASFLTKHLMLHYQKGEAHFMKYLSDGDWAQNNMGWQWSAGCGCDAQPYFRVFNPITQGKKFDPEGDYVRRYVPELANVPARHIHAPWEAPAKVLEEARVVLGKNYPHPIVDHKAARERFLQTAKAHLKK